MIKEEEEKASEEKKIEEAVMAEINARLDAARIALKDAADKFQVVASDKTDDLKDFASVAFKSLKAGWEEARKTFDQGKK